MLDETSITLLRTIFIKSISSEGLNAQKFRAEHRKHLDLIDSLVSSGYIESQGGNYALRLTTLPKIADSNPQVGSLLLLCEHLFRALQQAYIKNPGATTTLDELSKLADLPRQKMYPGIPYLSEAHLISGFSGNLSAEDAFVTPSEKLLRYEGFHQVVEEMCSWANKSKAASNPPLPSAKISPLPSAKISPLPSAKISPVLEDDLTFEQLLHPVISKYALPLYKDGHLSNAVLNSITAVFDLIRQKTGLSEDGDKLIGNAFSLDKPYLILSEIESESGRNDQKGFIQIFKGAYQGIRNPKAHSLDHDLTPVKAAQYLVLASLLARRIDEAEVIKRES